MTLFVSEDDLILLTGYKLPKKQVEWLQNNGYIFEVNKEGKPNVLQQHLIAKMSEKPKPKSPNFGALKRG